MKFPKMKVLAITLLFAGLALAAPKTAPRVATPVAPELATPVAFKVATPVAPKESCLDCAGDIVNAIRQCQVIFSKKISKQI